MFYNKDEIEKKGFVENAKPGNYRNASYDLSISRIIDMNGKEFDDYKLKPQGMIYVVFGERMKLPADAIAFANVKTSLTKKGIMATNIGIIDPGYTGYISTLLINFGAVECFFAKGMPGLRITFSEIKAPAKPENTEVILQDYLDRTKENTDNLDEKFLNLTSVEKEVSSSLIKRFFGILAIFGVAGFFVSVYFQVKNSNQGEIDRAIKKFELQVTTLQEKNNQLEQKLKSLDQGVYLRGLPDSMRTKNNGVAVDTAKHG